MKKATLGVGLKSGVEDWFTSSSVADAIQREWLRQVAAWTFEEGCRRLKSGGWEPARLVTLAVMAHVDVTRIVDESSDIMTRFHPDEARSLIEHLFSEGRRLMNRGGSDEG
jgi:hypothetical protein